MRIKGQGIRLQAEGNRVEAGNYLLASQLASQNEEFTRQSTAVKGVMADRQIYGAIGGQEAGFAGSGFSASGSALDIMRDSAQQGAMQKQLIEGQGEITEAGYHQQAASFTNLANYASYAAGQQDNIADKTDILAGKTERNGHIMAGIHAASAVASIFV